MACRATPNAHLLSAAVAGRRRRDIQTLDLTQPIAYPAVRLIQPTRCVCTRKRLQILITSQSITCSKSPSNRAELKCYLHGLLLTDLHTFTHTYTCIVLPISARKFIKSSSIYPQRYSVHVHVQSGSSPPLLSTASWQTDMKTYSWWKEISIKESLLCMFWYLAYML